MSTAATGGPGLGNLGEDRIQGSHETYEKGEVSSIGALIGDVANDLSTLMRQEVALAKAEARESATRAGKGAGLLGGAGAAAFYAVLFLSIALWWALGDLIDSLGWYYHKKGDLDRALQLLLKAESLTKPEDATVFDHIGDTYQQLGKTAQALQYWQKSLALDGDDKKVAEKIDAAKQKVSAVVPAKAGK